MPRLVFYDRINLRGIMKIKQTNKNKLLIAISLFLALIAAFLVANALLSKNQSEKSTPQVSQPEIQKPAEESKKNTDNQKNNSEDKPVETHSDKPIQPVENPDHTYTVSMISSIEIENGSVFVRGGINNLSSDSGECIAELKHEDGTIVTKTTNLLPGPQSSSCKTIEVPIKQLKTGAWTMKLKYKNQNTTGETDAQKFTIQQ